MNNQIKQKSIHVLECAPFESTSFDKIYVDNSLEYLDDVMLIMAMSQEMLNG